jgi:hypothetical protein
MTREEQANAIVTANKPIRDVRTQRALEPRSGLMREFLAPTEDPCRNSGGVLVMDGHRGQTLQLSARSAARAIPRWSSTILTLASVCCWRGL